MFCTKCGAQLPDGSKFCTKCGTPTDVVASETTVMPTAGSPRRRFPKLDSRCRRPRR